MDSDDDYMNDSDDNCQEKEKNYTILNEEDINQRLEEDITRISTVLTVSRESASILLRHFNWLVDELHDAWFADEEKVRREVGLLEKPAFDLQIPDKKKKQKLGCGICFDSYPLHMMNSAACEHSFCNSCWNCYITTAIHDGPGCLTLQCPDPSCHAVVGENMIKLLVSDEDWQRYSVYVVRSYVESNRKTKWCPAPDCNYAVDFVLGSENYDVFCNCMNSFCWNCIEDAHRPVDCRTVAKWISKNRDESENTNWILVNSKPCPQCKRPIEKNNGCMHMTCSAPCRFQFCWLCLGAWSSHGGACNGYLRSKDNETENRKEMAKRSIQRYTHYYERWATNHKSRQKAVADLKQMQSVHMKRLREKQDQLLESQLKFITEAWLQIIECRRVLKWTYAYGFYLPEEEHTKVHLFEYLQGQAESGLERLHQCAEKEFEEYLDSNVTFNGFTEFHKKLTGLTSVTRNYFENLVQALENGLSDVDSEVAAACSEYRSSENFSGMSRTSLASQVAEDYQWLCEHCTYTNDGMTTADDVANSDCQMCGLPRYY